MDGLLGLPEFDRKETRLACGCYRTIVDHGFARYTELDIDPECRRHRGARASTSRPAASKTLRFFVLARDRFTCQYCGRSAPDVALEADHVIPVAAGGATEASNLKTACFDCNRGKRDGLIETGAQ